MKRIVFAVFIGLSFFGTSQTIAEANRLFDRFEYAQAAKAYEEIQKTKRLDTDSRKNLAYSYFVSGDLNKCFPLVDSLIKQSDTEPFFFYAHGVSAMEHGKYDLSRSSLLKYKSMDDEYDVDVLLVSCDSLEVWKNLENVRTIGHGINGAKAEINGSSYRDGYFVFKELGLDSAGVELKTESTDNGELVLAQAFWTNSEGETIRIALPSKFKHAAVISAAPFGDESNQFLLTITEPSSNDFILRVPHLYTATWDGQGSFQNLNPWIYSGIEDTSACAYATISAKGDRIVFSKQGRMTKGADLYTSTFSGGSWSKPVSFDALNTAYDETSPLISGDTILTFASNGRPGYGSLDLYKVSFNGINFGPIEHYKAPINSARDDFNFIWLNDSLSLFTSNRANGTGDDDVYTAIFPKIKPVAVDTALQIEEEDYISSWTDKRIYFDYDKFSIRDQKTIDEIASALKKFDGIKILIEGHTDSRGDEMYNLELGKQRAKTVYNEFVKLGVNSKDLEIVSKGESDALIDCRKGCTEEQHQQNRVVIIKLITD
jgi:outer membrane protein OmpA-like peptidoglycan-associated protein